MLEIHTKKYGVLNTGNFKKIGRGTAFDVYALNESEVIKIRRKNSFGIREGDYSEEILINLKGMPFIPKVYETSNTNEYHIVQRINGYELFDFTVKNKKIAKKIPSVEFINNSYFNFEKYIENLDRFFIECIKKRYKPIDLSSQNVIIDYEANVWIIDFEGFKYIKENKTEHYLKIRKNLYEYKRLLKYGVSLDSIINIK